jgi:hypothetical protein
VGSNECNLALSCGLANGLNGAYVPDHIQRFREITRENLDALVENSVEENRRLEYKREYNSSDQAKRKILSELSAFANTDGGDILIGVTEEDGLAHSLSGVPIDSIDRLKLSIQQLADSCLDPKIIDLQMTSIEISENKAVLAIRVPLSFSAPHALDFQGKHRFYRRTSSGVDQMDTEDLRIAFGKRTASIEAIDTWIESRNSLIRGRTTIVNLNKWPVIAVRMIPLGFPETAAQLNFQDIQDGHMGWWNLGNNGYSGPQWNVDGPFTSTHYSGAYSTGYTQYFRQGNVEVVDTSILAPLDADFIGGAIVEHRLIERIPNYVEMFQLMGGVFPLILDIKIFKVGGKKMQTGPGGPTGSPIDRDDLVNLPRVYIDDPDQDWATLLRPIFDGLWNAAGFSKSLSYNEDGIWEGNV